MRTLRPMALSAPKSRSINAYRTRQGKRALRSGVEIPSAQNQQAANFLVALRHADQIHRPLHALRHHGHRQFAHARQLHHLRHGSAYRLHIIQCQFVA